MVLIGVGARLREQLDEQLAAHDITLRHYGALGHLAASPELSVSDLARRARVTPQSMRATVDHLAAIAAVEHRRHGQGRASQVLVTDAGRALLADVREVVAALDADLLAGVDDGDRLRDALLSRLVELRDRRSADRPG